MSFCAIIIFMGNNLRTLKGFRDFLPKQAKKRAQVIEIFRKTFEARGFDPIETPTLEYASLLLGKYGTEADKLVYAFKDRGEREVALKYDQTVPTAKFLSMYANEVGLPFKRYQIQPVFRAEKPQAGRYREFLQCDIDIFGTTSAISDAQILSTTVSALNALGLSNYIKIAINDRAILYMIIKQAGIEPDKYSGIIATLDKLDKKSKDEVREELQAKGLNDSQTDKIFEEIKSAQPTENLKRVIDLALDLGVKREKLVFTPHLARGLDYYTSTIFEIVLEGKKGFSIAGGGRYDNLIEQLSGSPIPAVGIAFGFDRIMQAIEEKNTLEDKKTCPQILVTIFDPSHLQDSIKLTSELLEKNVSVDLYPDLSARLDKQFKYANRRQIPFVAIVGPQEKKNNTMQIKDMKTGKQEEMKIEEVIELLKS